MKKDAMMWQLIWLLVYTWTLGMVKSSICVTLLRIADTMRYFRRCVYVLLGMTVASWLITFIGLLVLCRPIAGNWDPSLVAQGKAECAPPGVIVALGYISTCITVSTDLACAVLPAFLLWNMQMATRNKILIGLLLSFGSLYVFLRGGKVAMGRFITDFLRGNRAGISTMIRAPSIGAYRDPNDNLPCKLFPTTSGTPPLILTLPP